jgi:chloramphenicol 3-O phosphotransferase
VGVIVDDVFLGGSAAQERLRGGLHGLHVLWVGVHCDPAVASAREAARGDRNAGMAALQAREVHADVAYDVEVDTTTAPAMQSARTLLAAVEE